jgi:glycosyltransferase involved in cell wall biosynthesis
MRAADLVVIPGDDRERLSTITPVSADQTSNGQTANGQIGNGQTGNGQTGNGQTGNGQLRTNHLHLAMAARTPIVASDHPHLSPHLVHGINAMIFPAGNAKSMAHRIERLLSQPQLYAQISDALGVALSTLKVPARWPELVDYWLSSAVHLPDGPKNQQRLFNWAFSSGRYRSLSHLSKK